MSSISPAEVAAREKCLENINEFILKCQHNITEMLDRFGWTPEHFVKAKNHKVCPYNSDHRMSAEVLEKHVPVCELTSQGISKEDAMNILQDQKFFYENASCVCSVKLDLDTVNSMLWNHHVQNHSVFYGYKKLPQTPKEEEAVMSREDRLAVAEYIVRRAKEANRLKELGQDELLVSENLADLIKKEPAERELNPVEEMAALRDYRRRRQTYRAKNVHITKKSHTEIMREVINNQMEMFSQSILQETEHDRGSQFSASGSRSRQRDDSGSRSLNRRRSRSQEKRLKSEDKRSRSRERFKSDDKRSMSTEKSRSKEERQESLDESSRSRNKRSRSRHRSRSQSRERKNKYRRSYSRSRSRSSSPGRKSKKSKHKKHKSKHKRSKKERRSSSRDVDY